MDPSTKLSPRNPHRDRKRDARDIEGAGRQIVIQIPKLNSGLAEQYVAFNGHYSRPLIATGLPMPRIHARGCVGPVFGRNRAYNRAQCLETGCRLPLLRHPRHHFQEGAKLPCRSGLPTLICWSNVSPVSASGTRPQPPPGATWTERPCHPVCLLRGNPSSAFAATILATMTTVYSWNGDWYVGWFLLGSFLEIQFARCFVRFDGVRATGRLGLIVWYRKRGF